jgi:hypothetical protein
MRATDRVGRDGHAAPVAPPDAAPAPVPVVFVPPATPEDDAEARRRWVEACDMLATIGALDA